MSAIEKLRELRVLGRQALGVEPRIRVDFAIPLEYHGNADGGWCIRANSLGPDAVVVDVGLGEDTDFSESISARYGCTVNGLDPTPRAIAYVKQRANPRLRLFELGLGAVSGPAEFFLPNNTAHVSGALRREAHLGAERVMVQLITVGQLFERLGTDHIDVLKLDIEGSEYDIIESAEFHERSGAIAQLCVEFHHRWAGRGRSATERANQVLRQLGFGCAWYNKSTNEEFTFVRRTG